MLIKKIIILLFICFSFSKKILAEYYETEKKSFKIEKFIKSKKTVVIKASKIQIKNSDLSIEKKICFYKNERILTCGKIVKIHSGKIYIKVKSKKSFRKITKKHRAKSPQIARNILSTKKQETIMLYWAPYWKSSTIANYNIIQFSSQATSPEEAANKDRSTLWKSLGKSYKTSPSDKLMQSIGLEFYSVKMQYKLGLHFSLYNKTTTEGDYYGKNSYQYLVLFISGYSLSVYGDYQFTKFFGIFPFSLGFEVSLSSLSLESTRLDDLGKKPKEIPEAPAEDSYILQSYNYILSLRLPIVAEFDLDKDYGISTGIHMKFPLYSTLKENSRINDDIYFKDQGKSAHNFASYALYHEKAKISWNFVLGFIYKL